MNIEQPAELIVVVYEGKQYRVERIDHTNGTYSAIKARSLGHGVYHASLASRCKRHVLPIAACREL